MDSYKSLITTSPSFHLLASLDAARYLMQTQGKTIIDEQIAVADKLKEELSKIKGLKIVNQKDIIKKHPQVSAIDKTKVLVNIKATGLPGYEIAKNLEHDHKVVLEKYEADNIFFIAILQNTEYEAIETAKRLKACINNLSRLKHKKRTHFPKFPIRIEKQISSYEIVGKKITEKILEKSIGLICAEDIVPYPPGIPLIAKGEIISIEHINYLKAIRNLHGLISLVINNDSAERILVVEK